VKTVKTTKGEDTFIIEEGEAASLVVPVGRFVLPGKYKLTWEITVEREESAKC